MSVQPVRRDFYVEADIIDRLRLALVAHFGRDWDEVQLVGDLAYFKALEDIAESFGLRREDWVPR